MHPTLFHLGRVGVSTRGVLVAVGLIAGLQLAAILAPHLRLDAERVWTLGLTSLLTLFLGERLLVIAFNLREFLAHPVWMLGLALVRDQRYFYGGALLAMCAAAGYISAWRLPWQRIADCFAPAAGVALAFASLGSLAAGTNYGRPTSAHWGIVYSSPLALRTSGTALGLPLIPVALYATVLHLIFAGWAGWLAVRGKPAGALWLFTEGLSTVLLGQLRYRSLAEPLIAGVFTPAQTLGVVGVILAALWWLDAERPGASTLTADPSLPSAGLS